ncbi:MAG: caspase family protein [Magnetococcales bacterium]|nr:caspase family protein [Magnetococcales bacterium]
MMRRWFNFGTDEKAMRVPKIHWLLLVAGLLIPLMSVLATEDRGRSRDQNIGKRVALVIGNGAYVGEFLGPLKNPVNDADDIAKALKGFNFEVMAYKNLNKEDMYEAISEFGKRAGNADATLFYFAGHGLQIKSHNYLMPVDASAESEALVAQVEGVDVNYVLEEIDNAKSTINMVMLDACRNNDFSGRFRGGSVRGLAPTSSPPKGTVIVYATDPGNVAADGEGRNGLFTAGLLNGFKAKDLSLDGVLLTASTYVEEKSGRKQTPYVNGPKTVMERFKFKIEGVVEMVPEGPAKGAGSGGGGGQSNQETLFWETIKGSQDAVDFEEYLKKFPNGMFSGLAQNRLKKLKDKPFMVAGGEPPKEPSPAEKLNAMDREMFVMKPSKLREGPTAKGKVVVGLKEGMKIHVLGRTTDGQWYRAETMAGKENKEAQAEARVRAEAERESERQAQTQVATVRPAKTTPVSIDNRYVDHGDGTITDKKTGLVGLKNANCFGEKPWEEAMASARSLANGSCGLSDGSRSGDWRLPTKEELPILMEWEKSSAFSGVQTNYYWSSSTNASNTSNAWYVYLGNGYVSNAVKAYSPYVWPVRGGQ